MKLKRKLLTIFVAILLFFTGTVLILYINFLNPVSKDSHEIEINIEKGSYSSQIADLLYENKLIKNKYFFLVYLKINNINNIKAGNYKLNQNMTVKEIVADLVNGNIYSDNTIRITFKEGINYRQLANVIASNTNNTYEDVMNILNDSNYIDSLISDYWFITEAIKNQNIYYSLEGYLFPDTYEFRSVEVTIPEIFKKLLDKMDSILTPYKNLIEHDTYSIHELLTLASMAEKEVTNTKDELNRKKVVSVFVNRLENNISLGSDITTRYSLKIDDNRPLTKDEYNTLNAYNTRNVNMLGLPAGPIAMVSKESIIASIERIDTNYLYFIANINTSETYFYETSREFEAKKSELQKVNGGY